MYISKNINFSFLANQNSDDDLTPHVVRVEKEKDSDGRIREVIVLKYFCRVDRKLLQKSNCESIDIRLSKQDLSYYRSLAKLTQTKVAVAKIRINKKEENEQSDSSNVSNFLKNRQEKRKDRKKKRKNSREARKNKRKNKTNNDGSNLFGRNKNSSGDKDSRRRGGFKNRDSNGKQNKLRGKSGNKLKRTRRIKTSMNSKVVLEPKSLIITAKASSKFRLLKNEDIYANAKKVSSINFGGFSASLGKKRKFSRRQSRLANRRQSTGDSRSRKNRLLAPDTILQIEKANYTDTSRFRPLYKSSPASLRTFQNQYLNMVESSIDPMHLFEDNFGKISFNQSRMGSRPSVLSNTKFRKIIPVIREVQRQIANLSSSRYEFKKIKDPSRYKLLECFGRISLEDLQALGNNAYILFIAKDDNGINIQAQSFSFRVGNVLEQMIKQSTDVKCSTSRKPSGVCKLIVSNNKSSQLVDVNIEVKKIKRQDNFVETDFYEIVGDHQIPARSVLSVVDGSINTQRRRPVNFKPSESLFFRSTINYRGKKYYNSTSASSKGVKGSKKNDNIPTLNIIVKIDDSQRGLAIDVTNISLNVAAIRLKKYKYVGSSKGKIIDTFDQERKINKFVFLSSEENSSTRTNFKFIDSDVDEDQVYMYVIECIMKNGERRLATDYFIEKYEARTETVKITDIDITASSFIPDASDAVSESGNEITRPVRIDFKISKIATEVDKIINNLFGNLFEIYSEELKKIKDVQGLVYSIEIQRIEEKTGDTVTVGKVTADKDGNCVFVDDTAPAFSSLTYKLIPRCRPANEVIASVVAQTPFLAKKTINRPVNFVSAAARLNSKNRKDRIFTAKKDKFSNRKIFKKGRLRSPKSILQQNSEDLFADASTGDIEYITVGGLSDAKLFDSIVIEDGFISEIRHIIKSNTQQSVLKSLRKRYYDLEFETNNDFLVDFYAIFIKEDRNIYLDGAMHSDDVFKETKQYRYLVEHTGSAGVVEYYVVPVLKTGKILSPQLISAQLIE